MNTLFLWGTLLMWQSQTHKHWDLPEQPSRSLHCRPHPDYFQYYYFKQNLKMEGSEFWTELQFLSPNNFRLVNGKYRRWLWVCRVQWGVCWAWGRWNNHSQPFLHWSPVLTAGPVGLSSATCLQTCALHLQNKFSFIAIGPVHAHSLLKKGTAENIWVPGALACLSSRWRISHPWRNCYFWGAAKAVARMATSSTNGSCIKETQLCSRTRFQCQPPEAHAKSQCACVQPLSNLLQNQQGNTNAGETNREKGLLFGFCWVTHIHPELDPCVHWWLCLWAEGSTLVWNPFNI